MGLEAPPRDCQSSIDKEVVSKMMVDWSVHASKVEMFGLPVVYDGLPVVELIVCAGKQR